MPLRKDQQMPSVNVAHVRQQGVDLIIPPLNHDFGYKTPHDQQEIVGEIQVRARSAGLAGTVVWVWDSGGGRMSFIAPQPWHPFFRGLRLRSVWASVNREISW
jgi:hypothetical protein